jgi:tRNA pseudouridine13 synthase
MSTTAPPRWLSFSGLPAAYGETPVSGRVRAAPEDFVVEEILPFVPDGEGEHVLLHLRKIGANTEWVARRLASHAGVPVSAVSYAGLKDRNAVASQWFSVHLGVRAEPAWNDLETGEIEFLGVYRHRRKLRRGTLRGNRFRIRVRELRGDRGLLEERLAWIGERGVPNYFGAQRFGKAESNLHGAHVLFAGQAKRTPRHLRGLWLSASRAQIFNEVLALRVRRCDWDTPLPGDRMLLAGTRSHFLADTVSDELRGRACDFDVEPSGPLWGAGDLLTAGEPAELERMVSERFPSWACGLAAAGMRQERRSLRLRVAQLSSTLEDSDMMLGFELPAGAFATAVLRELVGT